MRRTLGDGTRWGRRTFGDDTRAPPRHPRVVRSFGPDEWRQVREAGKLPFLLRYGFLGRGLPLGVVTALAISVYQGNGFPAALQTAAFYGLVAFCVSVFTLSGSLAAHANWMVHERRHPESG